MEVKKGSSRGLSEFSADDEVFRLSNDAVFIIDQNGKIRDANGRAGEIFGYTIDELIGMPFFQLHPKEEYEKSWEQFKETFENQYSRFSIGAFRKDGEKREVEVSASRIEKQGNTFFLSIVRDFTEQNKALRKIDQLSQFPEKNPYPVIRIDQDYRLEYANQASQQLLELLNISIGDQLPEYWKEQVEAICANGDCAEKRPNFEFLIGSKCFLFTVSSIPETGQKYLYGQDITDLKLYQKELKATNEELSTFIYKTHHDLKNPLSSLLGLIQLSETEISDETALSYLSMIHESAGKLDEILTSLIKAIEIKDGEKKRTQFDLEGLIKEVLQRDELGEGAESINLTYEIDEPLSTIYTDRNTLFYVLENLLSNAIKYRDEEKANRWVQIQAKQKEKGVDIIVSDNGMGIPPEYQDQIFDMFYRATNARKGTGLGLYIANKGVKKLGGTIELESEQGKGTTFTIHIPYA